MAGLIARDGIRAFERMRRVYRSFSARFVVLLVIFVAVPAMVYLEFREADAEKVSLLRQTTTREGRLITAALTPHMQAFRGANATVIAEEASRLAPENTTIRVLFRPVTSGAGQGLFLVAATPAPEPSRLDVERARLVEAGAFDRVDGNCSLSASREMRYVNVAGGEEVLTALNPVRLPAGCWIVLVSKSDDIFLSSSLGRAYWQSTEVKIAGGIYILFALVVLWMFLDVWRNLRRFAHLARRIRTGEAVATSFRTQNRVPEISGVATEFDRLVVGLRSSAKAIRDAAEDNAHALKGPLAVITQSVTPLRRIVGDNPDAHRALARIEDSAERLDRLVNAARELDNTMAELLEAPHAPVDLSDLVRSIVLSFRRNFETEGPAFEMTIENGLTAWGSDLLFETAIENVLENALSYASRAPVSVCVSAHGGLAEIEISDRGPGVSPEDLDRIFERYFSDRPERASDDSNDTRGIAHFGIGLWIARRNFEAVGGTATAENRPGGGLTVRLRVPLAGK